jgi:pimeloyl-ACP methyl ester carboxylesterase
MKAAILIPGILGSTLRVPGTPPTEIWSKDASKIYDSIVNSNLLRYFGTAAQPLEILDEVSAWRGFFKERFYIDLIQYIRNHSDYSKPESLTLFAYDWRQNLDKILSRLQDALKQGYRLNYDNSGRAESQNTYEFYLIGHSMGAVLALLALTRGLIHPNDVRKLILLAPPLRGSPAAFGSLVDRASLPFLVQVMSLWSWRKNATLAWDILHDVLASFPSIYELMPPDVDPYIFDVDLSAWLNPFAQGVLDRGHVLNASRMHSEIRDSVQKSFPLTPVRVHVFYGFDRDTVAGYYVRRTTNSLGQPAYKLDGNLRYHHRRGDGTVLQDSALYGGAVNGCVTSYPYRSEHSTMCQDQNVMQVLKTLL